MLPLQGVKEADVVSNRFGSKIESRHVVAPCVNLSSVASDIDTLKKGVLTAEDIKQSKDRINTLKNFFPFYSPVKHKHVGKSESLVGRADEPKYNSSKCQSAPKSNISKEKLCSEQDEEKDTCDRSDSESIQSIPESKPSSIVHSRIASYEGCEQIIRRNKSDNVNTAPKSALEASYSLNVRNAFDTSNDFLPSTSKTLPVYNSKGKKLDLNALKDKYQNAVTNLTYDEFTFDSKKSSDFSKENISDGGYTKIPKKKLLTRSETEPEDHAPNLIIESQDNLIYRLQSEIDILEARNNKGENLSNVIIGNKDILKLLSNKHLANLNIRVEKNNEYRKDNRWRDNNGSFKSAKSGIRASLRSSKRKKKTTKYRTGNNCNNFEEKGTSDSTLKENESESEEELHRHIYEPSRVISEVKDRQSNINGEYVKKKFPEYAKVNKRKSLVTQTESDAPPRSLSTSPIERAPVMKKISSSSSKLKKDSEPSLMVNPVKKVDSFRGSRVTRRNSFLYNTRGKTSKEGLDQESFVKTQAVRLRRKDSRNSKQSEYRVSVTIRPSTVANLANKFNTIILQNQPGNTTVQSNMPFGQVSVTESKIPKHYSSPRASFKRKYRHKSSKASKEAKAKQPPQVTSESTSAGIDNTIYYTESISVVTRRSLNNSLSELNMKDLFEDSDYNKTDEEKVCEKLKTALSSAKFKGETDDSEDDLSSKAMKLDEETFPDTLTVASNDNEATDSSLPVEINNDQALPGCCDVSVIEEDIRKEINKLDTLELESDIVPSSAMREGHFKSDSVDSGISADDDRLKEIRGLKESKLNKNEEISVKTENNDSGLFESIASEEASEGCNAVDPEISQDSKEFSLNWPIKRSNVYKLDATDDVDNACYPSLDCSSAVPIADKTVVEDNVTKEIVDDRLKVNINKPIEKEESLDSINLKEDSNSEASSICSDFKEKKTKDDMGIYTSLKTAVKNTVLKSKDKDVERKGEKDKKKRSTSQERNKWFKGSKSKERNLVKSDSEETYDTCHQNKKEAKLYEKWAFKRKNRDKSNERKPVEKSKDKNTGEKSKDKNAGEKSKDKNVGDKSKDKNAGDKHKDKKSREKIKEALAGEKCKENKTKEKIKDKKDKGKNHIDENKEMKKQEISKERYMESENESDVYEDSRTSIVTSDTEDENFYDATSELYQDFSSDVEDCKESLYGKLKFASRSRSREKRLAKKMSRVEIRKLNAMTDPIQEESELMKIVDGETYNSTEGDSLAQKDDKSDVENTEASPLKESQLTEPDAASEVKYQLPPPPKDPIPSPPGTFLRLFLKNKTKQSIKKENEACNAVDPITPLDANDTTENIYENLYSPDMTKLKRNREKLEGRGIKPNTSFLWSGTAVVATPASVTKAILDQVPAATRNLNAEDFSMIGRKDMHDKFKSISNSEDCISDGHNYTEIQNNLCGDSQTIAYDDIGAASAVSYDEIAAPSSCGYDDIRPPSPHEGDFDHYKAPSEGYDPVNPPKSDSSQYDECTGGVVTAQLAVVRQEQNDALSYVYDDVSMYNSSIASYSYEPVCPPDPPISIIEETSEREIFSEDITCSSREPEQHYGEEPEYGAHEVFSYKLTQLCNGSPLVSTNSNESEHIYGASRPSTENKNLLLKMKSGTESDKQEEDRRKSSVKNKKKHRLVHRTYRDHDLNHWEDLSDSEDEKDIPVTITTRIPFVRKPNLKRVARYRVNKKSWLQGVRDVAAHTRIAHIRAHTHSTNLAKVHPHNAHASTHITHTRSHTHIRTNSDHVITYSWRQKPSDSFDGILRWKTGMIKPPARTPSKLSTVSSSSKSSNSSNSSNSFESSSSSSCSSSFSSIASHSSCTLPGTPTEKDEDFQEQVYVSSSSTIILIGLSNDETGTVYDEAYETPSLYYNASNLSSCSVSDYESAKIRSIYFEDDNANELQEISCYVEGGESDNEESTAGLYEAIYEVISPADEEKVIDEIPDGEIGFGEDLNGPLDDDSFDSDESDEAYSRLQPQYFDEKEAVTIRDRVESFSSDISGDKCESYSRHKYNRSQSYQPHSINKLAEAANLGMKRLRRNWSVTKNEVRTGLSKIKKKSAFSAIDAKSTEDIFREMNSSQSEKAKWSFRSHFRRKSSSSTLPLSLCNEEKDKATFYLTLTIASDGQVTEDGLQSSSPKGYTNDDGLCSNLERRKSNTPSISSVATTTSCDTSVSSRSRPLSLPGTILLRHTSSGSSSGTLLRPTTAPPAPPVGDADEEEYHREISKEQLASRLNQILSAGPIAPPGRKILRTSDCSSPETSPHPLPISPSEDKSPPPFTVHHSKYSTNPPLPHALLPHRGSSSLSLCSEIANSIKSNVPQARLSVASSTSSHGYIRASDIASSPPPLPARPTSIPGSNSSLTLARLSNLSQSHPNISAPIMISGTSDIDSRSYLDLTYDARVEGESPYMSSHFADEPLYQFYTAKVERAALYQGDSSEDDYEVINDGGLGPCLNVETPSRPTAMELVTPKDGRRTLWCELPEVINSGILTKISSQERKVQEAIFEVVTSEASYLKSLEVLVKHFMNCTEFARSEDPVITARERNVLFSDIIQVKKCSELFLADLEKRWQESFMISRITDIIHNHSKTSFNVYVKYCSNQIYQDRKLRDLKDNNPRFMEVLNRLESAPICQSLAMHSFLMLPMQRITRLPLLVDAIFNRLEYGSSQWEDCKTALASLQRIVSECNEGARKMERMEEMLLISHQLDFREVKAIPLISASRWLVKKGELTRLTWKEGDAKLTFGRKISKHSLYFFLFTDLLVVTKKKSEEQHMVLDYCPRNMVQVLELESADKFPGRLLDGHKNLIIMTMLKNHENKTVEMVLSCPLESDRTRWIEGVTPRISENPDERIYEEWDCPQVQAVHPYISTQPDEISLEVSDVFNVLKKTSDGWYQGERLRDGNRGWFPGNHTVEIASAHVRARNLRRRYRLLAISGSIVDELKKEKEKCEKEEKKKERRRTITIKEVL